MLLRATPVTYTWTVTPAGSRSSGQAVQFTTSQPGQPYAVANTTPVSHTFTAPGTYELFLATTYIGHYSLNAGATWIPIPGAPGAASTPITTTVHTATNHLTD